MRWLRSKAHVKNRLILKITLTKLNKVIVTRFYLMLFKDLHSRQALLGPGFESWRVKKIYFHVCKESAANARTTENFGLVNIVQTASSFYNFFIFLLYICVGKGLIFSLWSLVSTDDATLRTWGCCLVAIFVPNAGSMFCH